MLFTITHKVVTIIIFLSVTALLVVMCQNCFAQSGLMAVNVSLVKTSGGEIVEDILSVREISSGQKIDSLRKQPRPGDTVTLGQVKIGASIGSESLLHLQDKGIEFYPVPSMTKSTIACRFVFYTDSGGRKQRYPYSFSFDVNKTYTITYRINLDVVFVLYIEPVKS